MGKFTFGQTGVSYECDRVDMMKAHEGAPKCPRCEQRVYFNEEKKALGRSWHSRCFTCCQCNKPLSSTNYNEYNGELMCAPCHRRYSGVPKATPASTNGITAASAAAAAETVAESCGSGYSNSAAASTLRQQSVRMVNRDDPESCPQCGLKVYFAEEVKALKRKWHRLCFKCVSCKKTMEPGRCTEHQGQLLCQPCHGKLFGPLGLNNPSGAAAAGGDARSCSGGFYTDAFGTVEYQPFQPTQPIRGAQEWTESIFLDPTPARDRFTS